MQNEGRDRLSAQVLGQLLLMQSVLGNLPNEKAIHSFVCHGLTDIPGVAEVNYAEIVPTGSTGSIVIMPIDVGPLNHGVLLLHVSDMESFSPYREYLKNFCFMLAVILEERHKRREIEAHQSQLEQKVSERTAELRLANEKLKIELDKRTRAEAALEESTRKLRLHIQNTPVAVIEWDSNFCVSGWNPAATRIFGYTESQAKGKHFSFIVPPHTQSHVDTLWDQLSNKQQNNLSTNENITKDGRSVICEWFITVLTSGKEEVIGVASMVQDITEKQKIRETLQRADKLDSIGVLAGGIAHDFNNLLGGIFGFLDLAFKASESGSRIKMYLEKAMTVYKRTKNLTQQLLTFSHGGAPVRKPGHLAPKIHDSARFASSGSNVAVQFNIPENLWLCDFDENQMGQVIDNLVINAQQAMPNGGNILIEAENRQLEKGAISSLPSGKYIKISISDTGPGIPTELIQRIFDPFFTTKQEGNGLGLATTYSIIGRHDGHIDVKSQLGKGTTFHIHLPVSKSLEPESETEIQVSHQGQGKVLIMDDQDFILDVAFIIFQEMGYSVVTAIHGDQVIQLFKEAIDSGSAFDLAILDLTIPGGKGGVETLAHIKQMGTDTPVVASSGYAVDPVMSNPRLYGFVDSIKKPYRTNEIAELLNRILK